MTDVVGMLFQTSAHKARAHRDHLERGAWRSGSGSSMQMHERERLFEEAEMMDRIEETKEIVTDPNIAEKLY